MAKSKQTQEDIVVTQYIALTPIEHDLEKYAEGDIIVLSASSAAPLLAVNAIKLAPAGDAA